MKWGDLIRALTRKAGGVRETKKKHDVIYVHCDGVLVGRALISRGSDDMRGREIGHCATSLNLSEAKLREFVACRLSGDEYCAMVVKK